MSILITSEVYKSLGNMFLKLKLTESWRGRIPTQEGFSKEDKEGLNLIIFSIFKEIMLDENDDLTALPAYIVARLYKKAYTWDAKPGNMTYFRELFAGFDNSVEEYVFGIMESQTSKDFADFIKAEARKLPDKVSSVYKAARVFGDLIEYEEMREKLRPDVVEKTRQNIVEAVLKFKDLPHFMEIIEGVGEYQKLKTLIKTISASRYIFRWQGYICNVRCSILDHMLESAVISYLMNLEQDTTNPKDVLKDFWVLMFHDLSEIWTDDIPSPVKDGIKITGYGEEFYKEFGSEPVTFRKLTELQEIDALENHFYNCLPDKAVKFFKDGVMLEDVDDKEKKRFYKCADYFSADFEVWWNIKGGSREWRFIEIIKSSCSNNRTPAQCELLEYFVKQCANTTFMD